MNRFTDLGMRLIEDWQEVTGSVLRGRLVEQFLETNEVIGLMVYGRRYRKRIGRQIFRQTGKLSLAEWYRQVKNGQDYTLFSESAYLGHLKVIIGGRYDGSDLDENLNYYDIDHWMRIIKYPTMYGVSAEQQLWAMKELSLRMLPLISLNYVNRIDGVIAVPSSTNREFDLPLNLAKLIAEELNVLDLSANLLKTRNLESIKNTYKSERANKLKDAYSWSARQLTSKRYLIVDDVVTTGSTIKEVAKSIEVADSKFELQAFVIARTSDFNFWL